MPRLRGPFLDRLPPSAHTSPALRLAPQRLLGHCVWNDTLFLAKNNIMDYSLLGGLARTHANKQHEAADTADGRHGPYALRSAGGEGEAAGVLVVGIIDYVRQYTVDKLAETVVKTLYDPSHQPTVIEPAHYKRRFREAMDRYFVAVPSKYESSRTPS